jgi:hypothetical protein
MDKKPTNPTKPQAAPEIVFELDEDYKEHPISDAFGGWTGDGMFHVTFCSTSPAYDSNEGHPLLVKVGKVKVVLSPIALKQLSDFLANHARGVVVGEPHKNHDTNEGYV